MINGARFSQSRIETVPDIGKVSGTRTGAVATSMAPWERETGANPTKWLQQEDDRAAAALSFAMSFLVHSVRDGALLDEWLITNEKILSRLSHNNDEPCANSSTMPSSWGAISGSKATSTLCTRNPQPEVVLLNYSETRAPGECNTAPRPHYALTAPYELSPAALVTSTGQSKTLQPFPATSPVPKSGSNPFLSSGVNALMLEVTL